MRRVALALAGLVVACSSAPPANAPDFELSEGGGEGAGGANGGDDGPDLTPDEPGTDGAGDDAGAPPSEKTFAGSLATTDKAAFGGGGYCDYEVTLSDVTVALGVVDGAVRSAEVHDHVIETTTKECPYAPMDPADQVFTLRSSSVTADGTRLEFLGADANQPKTALLADLVAAGAGYQASLTWTRTDQGPPLKWVVNAKVALSPK